MSNGIYKQYFFANLEISVKALLLNFSAESGVLQMKWVKKHHPQDLSHPWCEAAVGSESNN